MTSEENKTRWVVIWDDEQECTVFDDKQKALADAREFKGIACLPFKDGDGL